MRKTLFAAAVATVSLVFLAGAADARQIIGTTKAYFAKGAVTALATDGSKYTANVTVTSTQHLSSGKTLYTGTYNLTVPNGKQVMLIFSKVSAAGLTPKTVAHFTADHSTTYKTWHFHVANPPAGGADVLALGAIKVGGKLAVPESNPEDQVDEDGDGNSDFDDDQGENDDVADDQGDDQDGDGVPDSVDDDDNQGDQQ